MNQPPERPQPEQPQQPPQPEPRSPAPAAPAPPSESPAPATPPSRPTAGASASPATGEINYAAWAILGGGFVILVGIFLNWFTVSASFGESSVSASAAGTEDWTGVIALFAAIVAIAGGGAAVLMSDPGMKRGSLVAGMIAAVVGLIMTVVAFFRASGLGFDIPDAAGQTLASVDGKAAIGLYISFLGAVIATAGAVLAIRKSSVG